MPWKPPINNTPSNSLDNSTGASSPRSFICWRLWSTPSLISLAYAPYEDEEITPELAAELDRARDSMDRGGEGISHEEVLRHYGLKPR